MLRASCTFKEEYESPLRQTRLSRLEPDDGAVRRYVDDLLAERAAVAELRRRHVDDVVVVVRRRRPDGGEDVEEVVTAAAAFDVQLEVEQRDADRLRRLDSHRPATLDVHVVLGRIVGAGDVAALRPVTAGGSDDGSGVLDAGAARVRVGVEGDRCQQVVRLRRRTAAFDIVRWGNKQETEFSNLIEIIYYSC